MIKVNLAKPKATGPGRFAHFKALFWLYIEITLSEWIVGEVARILEETQESIRKTMR